ncbi:hypothetical protein R3P38DRAFT_2842390 [Favolaschia claudopus]|uniref:Uncharacterized protein n=1 Tax=Favolaschia claudopus TaxID=2862362 RepID=A0AAW0E0F0_9AGAR
MGFRDLLDTFATIYAGLKYGLPAVFRAVVASPALLLDPAALSRVSMAGIWVFFGPGGDGGRRAEKTQLITPNARGVVLDLGAGHGHTVNYLDRNLVTKYIALEPNTLMHSYIRAMAAAAGYTESDGTLLILSCGAEDTPSILSSLNGKPVDTVVSVLTFCTIPFPQQTIRSIVLDLLASNGGELLFFEHVQHGRDQPNAAWWQGALTPLWKRVFDGCCLNRPTHTWVKDVVGDDGQTPWRQGEMWGVGNESESDLFWIRMGRFVKK